MYYSIQQCFRREELKVWSSSSSALRSLYFCWVRSLRNFHDFLPLSLSLFLFFPFWTEWRAPICRRPKLLSSYIDCTAVCISWYRLIWSIKLVIKSVKLHLTQHSHHPTTFFMNQFKNTEKDVPSMISHDEEEDWREGRRGGARHSGAR